jgi:microcystin-dependent protein
MDQPFIGMIVMFAFTFAPRGWALCAGQQLAVSSNAALFALIGTNFGGNGSTTFGLPDLRGRTAVGMGAGPGLTERLIGQMSGSESNVMLLTQMPAHTHAASATSTSTLYAEGTAANAQNPAGKMLASGQNIYATEDEANNRAMSSQAVTTTTSVSVNVAGGGQPVNNMQPFLAVNYCIALEGLFPSRN